MPTPKSLSALLMTLLCASCGDWQPELTVIADGDWGWEQGAGCEGMRDVIRTEGDTLTIYRNGEAVETARLENREALIQYEPQDVDEVYGTVWTYVGKDPENPSRQARIRDSFDVSYWMANVSYLTLMERNVMRGPEPEWIELENDPRLRQRLSQCPE
jgi:hypothetical protein